MSCGKPPVLAVAREDGGGPGLRALLTAPRGLEIALVPDRDGASETARSEGGRGACKAAGGPAKSSTAVALVVLDDSGVGDDLDGAWGSDEIRLPGGEFILG